MNPPTATNKDRDPDPIVSLPTELDQLRDQAEGLRSFLGNDDPTGELSTLLLVAALHRVDDLFTQIEHGEKADEVLIWTPLRDLPDCVTKAGGPHLQRVMLVLIAELARDFVHGFGQPDTTIGALALEIVLAEALFLAELWGLPIIAKSIPDLRDPLMLDTDHLWLYNHKRKLAKKDYRALFESHFEHPHGSNGLHPYVEMK